MKGLPALHVFSLLFFFFVLFPHKIPSIPSLPCSRPGPCRTGGLRIPCGGGAARFVHGNDICLVASLLRNHCLGFGNGAQFAFLWLYTLLWPTIVWMMHVHYITGFGGILALNTRLTKFTLLILRVCRDVVPSRCETCCDAWDLPKTIPSMSRLVSGELQKQSAW